MSKMELKEIRFLFQVGADTAEVTWFPKGAGTVNGRLYPMTYSVEVNYKGNISFLTTSHNANKSNSADFIICPTRITKPH